jgi:nicotinate phosphoribosyltransferase
MHFSNLKFTSDDIEFLASTKLFKYSFLAGFLPGYRNNNAVVLATHEDDGSLSMEIQGLWANTVLYEVPILAIISEVLCDKTASMDDLNGRLNKKLRFYRDCPFHLIDFGTRRRYSKEAHKYIVGELKDYAGFMGTSNVWLAKKYDLSPRGTMAHEWLMAGQAFTTLKNSQPYMLKKWADTYEGRLGIALSDTLGTNSFLDGFDGCLARLYDGVRQDSGDPYEWFELILSHYKSLGIDASTKQAVFSDSLDFEKARKLHEFIHGRMKDTYGIGTFLTNDTGLQPPNIVIKMTYCGGCPLIKLSDSPGKVICESPEYAAWVKSALRG